MQRLAVSIFIVAACSARTRVDNTPDAAQGSTPVVDASTAITISGLTLNQFGVLLPNVSVAAYTPSGASAGTSVTSSETGAFSMTVELTDGQFDGYLAASNGAIATHAWPLQTLTIDASEVSIRVFNGADSVANLFSACSGSDPDFTYNSGDGLIGVEVTTYQDSSSGFEAVNDADVMVVQGDVELPEEICYLSKQPDGLDEPSSTTRATDVSGMAFVLNTPASESVEISAQAEGLIFSPVEVPVVAGVMTTTFVIGE